ncbi:MAG: T9SS type A sorting domain-containing protein [Saprospiraceae bacterium]|nr:T9SS type A sorting domain-containing protein [Saprospiraceae bacterium]
MNLLTRVLLASLMTCPLLAVAQLTPFFQTSLYFQDSIGHRDTLVIGYDTSASSQHLNPQFGELLLTTPFDSVFEVRAMHRGDSQERTIKKIIGHYEIIPGLTCGVSSIGKIVINAKYPPISMTYDSTKFPIGIGNCKNVVLSPEWNIFFLQQWWNVCDYYCLGSSSVFIEDFAVPPPASGCWNRLFVEKEVDGQGLKMLPGFFLEIFSEGPCNDSNIINIKTEPMFGLGVLKPNPVREQFSIDIHPYLDVKATTSDMTGRLVACPFIISAGAVQFDAKGLSPGIYFISLYVGQNGPVVYKFVKV